MAMLYYRCVASEPFEYRVKCTDGGGNVVSPGPTLSVSPDQTLKCSDLNAQDSLANASDPFAGTLIELLEEEPPGPIDIDVDAIIAAFLAD